MHLQMMLVSGVSRLIAVDLNDTRLAVARKLGAHAVINASTADPLQAIQDLTHGMGTDVSIEASGTPAGWDPALKAVRKGGRVLWFGGLCVSG